MTIEPKPNQTVAQAAIATQQPEPLKPGEVAPEVLVNATSAPNPFANDDEKLEALLNEQKALDDAKATKDAQAAAQPAATPAAAAPAKTGQEQAVAASRNTVESAVIALRKKASTLQTENLVLKGENLALKSMVQPGGAVAPAGNAQPAEAEQPTFEESFKAIDVEYATIAEKVDNGELSMKEAEVQRQAVRTHERQLADERAAAVANDVALQNNAASNDLGLQEHVTKLVESVPVLKNLSKEQLLPFEQLAYEKAQMSGNPIPSGPMGTKRLREEMALLAEQFYDPKASAARAAQKPGAAPGGNGQPQPSGGAQPGPGSTQPSAQQREAKLQQAGNMPPDIGAVGAGATGGEITEAQGAAIVANLKDDELIRWLDQHPQFVQKHMAGVLRPSR